MQENSFHPIHFLIAKVSDKVGFGAKTLFAFCSLFVRRVV